MERKLAVGGIGGGGREERRCGCKTSTKGQHENGCIGSEGMNGLGAGGRVPGGLLRQGGSNASGRKKGRVQCVRTLTCASGRIWTRPFHFSDGMSPGGRTQNRSLRYKRLERPVHRVSRERQNARYFFC